MQPPAGSRRGYRSLVISNLSNATSQDYYFLSLSDLRSSTPADSYSSDIKWGDLSDLEAGIWLNNVMCFLWVYGRNGSESKFTLHFGNSVWQSNLNSKLSLMTLLELSAVSRCLWNWMQPFKAKANRIQYDMWGVQWYVRKLYLKLFCHTILCHLKRNYIKISHLIA